MEEVIFSWTGLPNEQDDVVDVLSDASNEISLKVAREVVMHQTTKAMPKSVSSFSSGSVKAPHYGISSNHY
jgi:hypothetical protein